MNEKIKISIPIIVEGRYDKSVLSSIFDATVITTGGFSVFNSKEKTALIKKLAERGGIILLTDSDAGGRQIRSYLSGILPPERIFHVYIPEVKGKEKRKKTAGAAGLLGVEGMDKDVLVKLLSPFAGKDACQIKSRSEGERLLTKLDFFNDGLSGGDGATQKRALIAKKLDLPTDMSAKALIEAINLTVGYEAYKAAYSEIFEDFA